MNEWDSRRSQVVGIIMLTLGIAVILSFFVDVSKGDRVIDTALTLEPGETYGTRYSPRVGVHILKGRVFVEGEGIAFAFYGDLGDSARLF